MYDFRKFLAFFGGRLAPTPLAPSTLLLYFPGWTGPTSRALAATYSLFSDTPNFTASGYTSQAWTSPAFSSTLPPVNLLPPPNETFLLYATNSDMTGRTMYARVRVDTVQGTSSLWTGAQIFIPFTTPAPPASLVVSQTDNGDGTSLVAASWLLNQTDSQYTSATSTILAFDGTTSDLSGTISYSNGDSTSAHLASVCGSNSYGSGTTATASFFITGTSSGGGGATINHISGVTWDSVNNIATFTFDAPLDHVVQEGIGAGFFKIDDAQPTAWPESDPYGSDYIRLVYGSAPTGTTYTMFDDPTSAGTYGSGACLFFTNTLGLALVDQAPIGG